MTMNVENNASVQPSKLTDNLNNIILTNAAIAQVKKWQAKRGAGIGIRLAVKKTGCSGLAYHIEMIDQYNENDQVFTVEQGLIIAVDPVSYAYVKGTLVDYVRQGLKEEFKFTNPNQKGACGCGESFIV